MAGSSEGPAGLLVCSRAHELQPDYGGAQLAGRPQMLAALKRLAANHELVDTSHAALASFKISGAKVD